MFIFEMIAEKVCEDDLANPFVVGLQVVGRNLEVTTCLSEKTYVNDEAEKAIEKETIEKEAARNEPEFPYTLVA